MCSHENKYDQGKQPTKESRNRVERVGTPWLHECWKAGESLPQIRSGRTINSIQRGVETTDNNLHADVLAEQFQTRQGRNRDIIWFVHAKLISATKHAKYLFRPCFRKNKVRPLCWVCVATLMPCLLQNVSYKKSAPWNLVPCFC